MKKYKILLLLLLCCAACYRDQNNYIQAHKSDILQVYASIDSMPADGKTIIVFTARISATAEIKKVKFSTTNGTFLDSAATYTSIATMTGDSLVATSYLISPLDTTSYAFVTVSVPGVDTTIKVKFFTALPEKIHTESSVASIQKGYNSSAPLQTYLTRQNGTPSRRQLASYIALRDDSTSIGYFRNISPKGSDSAGLIQSTFVLANTLYLGRVRIISSCPGLNYKQLQDTFLYL